MQRLTKYSLLFNPIAKKTTDLEQKKNLNTMVSQITSAYNLSTSCHVSMQIEEVNSFVCVVDNTIRVQEETERVREAMSRITAYNVVDIPHELRDVSK